MFVSKADHCSCWAPAHTCVCAPSLRVWCTPTALHSWVSIPAPGSRHGLTWWRCNGSCIVSIAAGSLICNTLAVKIGKRPVYLATTLGLAVSCFWAAEVKSFGSLAGARTVQGFCMVSSPRKQIVACADLSLGTLRSTDSCFNC